MENIWEAETLSDIIMFNIDYQEIGETEMLNFNGTNTITLYVGLNKTNAEKLQNGKYKDILMAHEYIDVARKIKQAEVVVEISYNTSGLFDMIQPSAYNLIAKHITKAKLKKSEIKDTQIIKEILSSNKYSGVRAIRINATGKCYKQTEMVYKDAMLIYFLNPANIRVLRVIDV